MYEIVIVKGKAYSIESKLLQWAELSFGSEVKLMQSYIETHGFLATHIKVY